ncbi:MAG: hypothetical protein ABI488_22935 [Polyangiaceae bacterium]
MFVLDAGAFVALERLDRDLIARLKGERLKGRAPITHGGVVGQVWRGGAGRQAVLAKVLVAVQIEPLDVELGKRAGVLLARTKTRDVIDAALALLATDGDEILTSDPRDLRALVKANGAHVEIVQV